MGYETEKESLQKNSRGRQYDQLVNCAAPADAYVTIFFPDIFTDDNQAEGGMVHEEVRAFHGGRRVPDAG